MLRFQTEDDAQTGEKVLTCYLLPQQPPPSLGRSLSAAGRGRGWTWPRAGPGPLTGFGSLLPVSEDAGQQSSPTESWSEAPLGRVSVIKFLGPTLSDEDAEEAAAEKRVWGGGVPGRVASTPHPPDSHPARPSPCAHCRVCSAGPRLTPASSG